MKKNLHYLLKWTDFFSELLSCSPDPTAISETKKSNFPQCFDYLDLLLQALFVCLFSFCPKQYDRLKD